VSAPIATAIAGCSSPWRLAGERKIVLPAVTVLALAATLLAPATAVADFGPIGLLSKSTAEQATAAFAPVISADGRYLAFQGTIGGLRGVFRKHLETGAVEAVAAGSAYVEKAPSADSSAPSISADGRYVSFTTRTPLDPTDDLQASSSDVYVADMTDSPPSYELASAVNGSSAGLTYAGAGGSLASGRVALSADGRRVVFFTTAVSDLTSGPGGSTEGTPTPAGQVVLRNLETRETTLVSAARDDGAEAMTELPVQGGAIIQKAQLPLLRGAALSADGTTVAWLGANLPEQVPLPPGEAASIEAEDGSSAFPYDEPLWRRVADGLQAPTRRVVGGEGSPFDDLSDRNTEFNAAEGWLGVAGIEGVPQLSADGRIVALIGNPTNATNVFVVDMHDGASLPESVRPLTSEIPVRPTEPEQTINQEPYVRINGHVYQAAISADGQRIAFVTARQQFPLAPPNLVDPPPASLGLVELYRIDLEDEALQRVTHGYAGAGEPSLAPNGSAQAGNGASSPSFGAAGRLIAFSSTASNLIEGDGNEAADAFLVEDLTAPPAPGGSTISPPPPPFAASPAWRLVLSSSSLPDGAVRLFATVPAPGALWARAGVAPAEAPKKRLRLATSRVRAATEGPIALTLRLRGRYRRFARSREGLYATAYVSFRGSGGKLLRGALGIRFHAHRGAKGERR
jgi:Tol biopolymer transport system component